MARKTATEKVLFRLEKGMDDPERIAQESGCSRQYVDRIAKRGGYSLKTRLTGAAEMREQVAKLVKKGLKPIEIQEKLGATKRRIGYHLATLGAVKPKEKITRVTADRRADVRRRRLNGESVKDLAKEYGVKPQAITNDLRGLKTERSPERVAERVNKILTYNAQGRSTAWIADKMDMHYNSIRKIIRWPERRDKILALHAEGRSDNAIAKQMKMRPGSVRNVIQKADEPETI